MKRYIDFESESWPDRTYERMQAARSEKCVAQMGGGAPGSGVIDVLPMDELRTLLRAEWVQVPLVGSDLLLRRSARRQMMATLQDDVDCLSLCEHTLIERMLIGGGLVYLETVAELEAALTLRLRLWCDVGTIQDEPVCKLDKALMRALPRLMMREEHRLRRERIFVLNGMLSGLLYLTGFLDDRVPRRRFIGEVLAQPETPHTRRLARNFLEASFDCTRIADCNLLLHGALATPEALVGMLAAQSGYRPPSITPQQLAGSMNGLLPEEAATDQKMQLVLKDALRPEYTPQDAAFELRMLIKQGAPMEALRTAMARMLLVLPTQHMESALLEMSCQASRWVAPWMGTPTAAPSSRMAAAAHSAMGMLH